MQIIAVLISLTIIQSSCTRVPKPYSPIPSTSKTIAQIYEQHHTTEHSIRTLNNRSPTDNSSLYGYSRNTFNELSGQFPRLPNPTILLYIFPHLSEERTPVPGYTTIFPMYESVEYANPGEVILE